MHSSRKGTAPEFKAFVEALEFDIQGPSLRIRRSGLRSGVMKTVVEAARIEGERNLTHFGMLAWPYVDGAGATVVPDRGPPTTVRTELAEMFEKVCGRALTKEENASLQASIVASAAESSDVRAWAEAIDFAALHAFDCTGEPPDDFGSSYGIVAGPDAANRALRRFAGEFPLLAGLAAGDGEIGAAAEGHESFSKGYEAAMRYVRETGLNRGLSETDTAFSVHSSPPVGPVPAAFLDRIRGLRIDVSVDGKEDGLGVANAIDLGRRLPVIGFPHDKAGFLTLGKIGGIVRALEASAVLPARDPRDFGLVDSVFEGRQPGPLKADELGMFTVPDEPGEWRNFRLRFRESTGLGMTFSDEDLRSMFSDEIDTGFSRPLDVEIHRLLIALKFYGLPGHAEWARDCIGAMSSGLHPRTPPGVRLSNYSALKDEMVRDGFRTVCGRATAFFEAAEKLNSWLHMGDVARELGLTSGREDEFEKLWLSLIREDDLRFARSARDPDVFGLHRGDLDKFAERLGNERRYGSGSK